MTRAGFRVVAEAQDIPAAEAQLRAHRPDLAVVDLMLAEINGLAGTARLKALNPDLRVIVVSVQRTQLDLMRTAAAEAGAEAFVPKDDLTLALVRSWMSES